MSDITLRDVLIIPVSLMIHSVLFNSELSFNLSTLFLAVILCIRYWSVIKKIAVKVGKAFFLIDEGNKKETYHLRADMSLARLAI